jgi:hypothetical protein
MMATNAKAITGPTVYASTTALARTTATATLDREGGHPPKMIMRQRGYPCLARSVSTHFCSARKAEARLSRESRVFSGSE